MLAAGKKTLHPPEIDDEVGALAALDHAGDKLAELLFVLGVNLIALCFPDSLEENLLSRHRGQSTEIFDQDLLSLVDSLRLACDSIDDDSNGFRLAHLLHDRRKQGGLDPLEDDLFLYVFVPMDRVHQSENLAIHGVVGAPSRALGQGGSPKCDPRKS